MPTDLHAQIIAEVARPLNDWLTERAPEAAPAALAAPTREGAGDLALPCHPYARALKLAPQVIAVQLAETLAGHPLVERCEAVAGFLNLRLNWSAVAARTVPWALSDDAAIGRSDALRGQKLLVEYCSPNTNKPLHLGHARNIVLGAAVAQAARAAGAEVIRINLINDRGIHICKSMLAWARFGEGATPESTGRKSDHLVGDLYVRFERALQAEWEAEAHPPGISRDDWFNGERAGPGGAADAARLGGRRARGPRALEAHERVVRGRLRRDLRAYGGRLRAGRSRIADVPARQGPRDTRPRGRCLRA
jgi:arginyl-tRNA synthetase